MRKIPAALLGIEPQPLASLVSDYVNEILVVSDTESRTQTEGVQEQNAEKDIRV